MSLDAFLPSALLGTARAPTLPALGEGAVGALFSKLQTPKEASTPTEGPPAAALTLLRCVAAANLFARAGFVPIGAESTDLPPAPDLSGERQRAAPISPLESVLAEQLPRLTAEVLDRMAQARLRAPGPVLRSLLDLGSRQQALRPSVIAVLGARGRWLAEQHEAWAWAKGSALNGKERESEQEQWDFGSLVQRTAMLTRERARDPQAARDRLMSELKELTPEDRTALIGALRIGLSHEDEPALVTLTGDRAREPREAAVALLSLLPESQLSKRMAARMAAMVTHTGGLIRKKTWSIEPPSQTDEDWSRDGLSTPKASPQKTGQVNAMGDRARWLMDLVAHTQPAWWEQHTGMQPQALVQWANDSDWAEPVLMGWLSALETFPTAHWAKALHDHGKGSVLTPVVKLRLLPSMTKAEREACWLPRLQNIGRHTDIFHGFIQGCPIGESLSAEFSAPLVQVMLKHAAGPNGHYGLLHTLADLVCIVDPKCLAPILTLNLDAEDVTPSARDFLAKAQSVARIRSTLSDWILTADPA